MADFLQNAEGLIPLLMLGGLFAGGKRKGRRSGNSGGGFLSMLLAQQAKRNESEMQQAARQEELRQQFLGKLLAEGVANGATIPEGLLSQAGVFGVTPEMYEQMRKDRFAKGMAQTIATLAPYAKDQETLDALRNIGNYGSLNEYLTSQRGVEAERARQLAEVILHQMKSGEAVKAAAGLGPQASETSYRDVFTNPYKSGADLGEGVRNYERQQESYIRGRPRAGGGMLTQAMKDEKARQASIAKLWGEYRKDALRLMKDVTPLRSGSGLESTDPDAAKKAIRDRVSGVVGTYYDELKNAGFSDEKIFSPLRGVGIPIAGKDAVEKAATRILGATHESTMNSTDAPTQEQAMIEAIKELEDGGALVLGVM